MRAVPAIGLVCLWSAAASATGAVTVENGEDPSFWREHSVVLARVESVEEAGTAGGHFLRLKLQATLTGGIDAGLTPGLSAKMWLGPVGSAIREEPKAGSTIVAVIRWQPTAAYSVPSSHITFLPSGCAIQPVDQLDLTAILTKVQAARRKAEAKAAGMKQGGRPAWGLSTIAGSEIARPAPEGAAC